MKRLLIVPVLFASALALGSTGMEFEITKMRDQAEASWTVNFPREAADLDLKFSEKGLPAEQLELLLTNTPRIASLEINGKKYNWKNQKSETIDLAGMQIDKVKGMKVFFEDRVGASARAVVSLKSRNNNAFSAVERLQQDRTLRLTAAEPDGNEPVVLKAEAKDLAVDYPGVTQGNGVNVYVIGNNNQIRVNEQPKPVQVDYTYKPSTYYTGWYYVPNYYYVYYPTWTYYYYYPTITYTYNTWYANYWGYFTWNTTFYSANFYGTNNSGMFGRLFNL